MKKYETINSSVSVTLEQLVIFGMSENPYAELCKHLIAISCKDDAGYFHTNETVIRISGVQNGNLVFDVNGLQKVIEEPPLLPVEVELESRWKGLNSKVPTQIFSNDELLSVTKKISHKDDLNPKRRGILTQILGLINPFRSK
jgi:hypothetical protein